MTPDEFRQAVERAYRSIPDEGLEVLLVVADGEQQSTLFNSDPERAKALIMSVVLSGCLGPPMKVLHELFFHIGLALGASATPESMLEVVQTFGEFTLKLDSLLSQRPSNYTPEESEN